jgi:hypothetical protein
VPVVTWMRNHRKRQEFRIGHLLDLAQEFIGQGNAASKRNIEEYHRVSELVAIGDHNRKQKDPQLVALTEEDKTLMTRYGIKPDLSFEEHPTTAKNAVCARLMGIVASSTTSIAFTLASQKWIPEKWRFRRNEKIIGEKVGNKVLARIPFMSRLFNEKPALFPEPGKETVGGLSLIGEYFFDDALLTAASRTMFDRAEKRQMAKMEAERKAREEKQAQSFAARREAELEAKSKDKAMAVGA